MEQRKQQTDEERLMGAYKRFEKPLVRLAVFGFVLIVLSQLALALPATRKWLLRDPLSGITNGSVTTTAGQDQTASLTITPVGEDSILPNVYVKVDGVPVASFTEAQVTVQVHEGDTVKVDSTQVPGVLRFQVDLNNHQVAYPVPGTLIESDEGVASFGQVEFLK